MKYIELELEEGNIIKFLENIIIFMKENNIEDNEITIENLTVKDYLKKI